MKTIVFTAALSLLACAAQAQVQENSPPTGAPESVKKALPAAAWLGIAMGDTDGKVVVSEIALDSPAAKAGLQKGDVLVRIGNTPIEGKMERVVKSVTGKQPGEAIEIHWQRGDKEGASRIELAARPELSEKDFRGEFRKEKEESKEDRSKDELERNLGKLRLDLDSADTDKMLRFYLNREWPGDKAGDTHGSKLRFGKEVPPVERFPDAVRNPKEFHLKMGAKAKSLNEDAIWKRVQDSVAGALKESHLGPDVTERVMQAVENARRAGSEKHQRRAKLEAEAAKLEKEMQNLKARADQLRDELNKSGE